ncbi:MAG: hypothetical protein QXR27_00965 [Archaeoglobaceae archaeon]
MRLKLTILTALVVILFLGCVEERVQLVAEKNVVFNCQCHEEPWKSPKHYANVTSCKSCHGNEILDYHKKLPDWKWETVAEVSCTFCHDPSLLANHDGKCDTCHRSIYLTHSKYLEKYVKR